MDCIFLSCITPGLATHPGLGIFETSFEMGRKCELCGGSSDGLNCGIVVTVDVTISLVIIGLCGNPS